MAIFECTKSTIRQAFGQLKKLMVEWNPNGKRPC